MPPVLSILLTSVATWFRSRLSMQLELIALRHQVAVYKQSIPHPKLRPTDRVLWAWLSRVWPGWQNAPHFVALIQDMWRSNPTWGAPRIVGELHKLGIDVAKSAVEKCRPRLHQPPSPTWKAFLANHAQDLLALDFFTVPTVTCRVLFVLVILAHDVDGCCMST
jgi:putative transposase